MGLFKNLITILIIKILFLQIDKMYTGTSALILLSSKDFLPELIDNSPCSKTVSRNVSQYVSYLETYKQRLSLINIYSTKRRVNYRKEYKPISVVEPDCCPGYTQIGTKCMPHCPQSCKKGYCLEPNVCKCHAGYRASNDTNGEGTCVPICTNGCINGTCVEPDICSCNENYWMDSDGITCRPVCNEECELNHGYCHEPYVCLCRSGYKKINSTCEPVCDRACTNGFCVAPNVCRCLDDYEVNKFDRFTCVPKCNETCVFGRCIEPPQTCICNDDYRAVNASVCEPICSEPCKMGTCIAPESCGCNDGYELRNGSSKYVCEPICRPDCGNGTCTAPGICVCDEGFVYDNQTRVCKPHCVIPCGPNETCTSPNTCTCSQGYRLIENMNTKLSQESVSVTFNKSIQNEEHQSLCEPVCNFKCFNGICTAPDVCTCIDDHEPLSSELLFFPPDWRRRICTRRIKSTTCNPPCGNNERCTASLTCDCSDGYTRHDDGHCVPHCVQDCSNGTCTAPGVCVCNEGFVYDNQTRVCKPHCVIPCRPNETCTSPNTCTCSQGYRLIKNMNINLSQESVSVTFNESIQNEEHQSRCEPVCHYECFNGICTAPDVCTCNDGYEPWLRNRDRFSIRNWKTRICVPRIQTTCIPPCGNNERCTAYLTCNCSDGYTRHDDGHCVPHCVQECSNGTCTAPNHCTCNAGFALRNESFCEPICKRGCQNGDCVGPNHCVCHDNFVLNTESHFEAECIPACFRNCSDHGACIVENDEYRCKCNYGWTGWDCDQPTVCVVRMDFNHSDIDKITIRNETNNTVIIQAYETAPYCYQCANSLNKESLCYVIHSDKDDTTPIIGCLFSTDLPCYLASHYNASSNVAKIIWMLVTIAISIAIILAAYLIYRRREKKKIATANMPVHLRESFVTESLLPESVLDN